MTSTARSRRSYTDELRSSSGFAFIALRDAAVEAQLIDERVRGEFPAD